MFTVIPETIGVLPEYTHVVLADQNSECVTNLVHRINTLRTTTNLDEEASFGWRDCIPSNLTADDDRIQYLMAVVAIDFRHWIWTSSSPTPSEKAVTWTCEGFRGSHAMTTLLKRSVESGCESVMSWYTVEGMKSINESVLNKILPGVPACRERVTILNDIGNTLSQRKQTFSDLVREAAGWLYASDGSGFIQRLLELHPRFIDFYNTTPILKLAQLSVLALTCAVPSLLGYFRDMNRLTLCADYQIPRSLRALGLLTYSPSLAEKVDQQGKLEVGGSEEAEIRCGAITMGRRVVARYRELYSSKVEEELPIGVVDYALWRIGRSGEIEGLKPHHLAETIMY
eukprot:PhF_6_TR5963/c0_g1_i1/m.8616